MVISTRSIVGLAVLSGLANAKIYAAPEATASFNLPLDQFSPQPTKAPANAELRRRQTSAGTTVLVAPDNTCGYISGRAGAAYTCGTAASCIFFTSATRPGFVACCDADDCGARRTCYDARQVSTSSLCDGGCMVDKFTLKCTNTARPFCNTISFPGSIFDYWCNTVDISTVQAAVTTFEGQTGRTWVPLPLTTDASSSLRAPSASGRFTATGSGSLVDPVASDPTNNDNDNDSNNNNNNKSSTPVGAIVGGVVGGLAVIALVGLGIFLILRKKKQPAQPQQFQQPTVNQQPPMAQGDYPSHASPNQYAAGSHTQSLYDPKFGAQGGYPQNFGGTPPPQGGYQQPGYFVAGNMVPDRADTTSPGAVSQFTDHRYSTQTIAPGYQPQQPHQQQQQQQQQFAQPQPTIHEAPATNDGHKGQMHELA
ncbi:hypothetical protein CkaCkLH20_12018 [Colletotrichum karsti]|uniref:Uncharacterized protein n=1 Tax=Colletotrichum karsti TaxID=1095194 RepID=A0A9P6HTT5_9PEZI|nr:uncharacterized protein CkaCkLH20_12018 [Colletotrichum karsti]KAF9870528.1 hypothetical protein CkaCkLH20_12018 [Colletotrichum karsti]